MSLLRADRRTNDEPPECVFERKEPARHHHAITITNPPTADENWQLKVSSDRRSPQTSRYFSWKIALL
jgi:hypothetical protein